MKVEKFIENSIFSAFMVSNLINDLLDLAKLENSAFQLNLEQSNLIEVVEKAFSVISFQAANKNIKLILSLDSQKPFVYRRVIFDIRRML
jgi:signal transduction histidine kinase